MRKTKPRLIAVVGPTASGKSDMAVDIAIFIKKNSGKFGVSGAEIISADSRQVYRSMNIGTGKITKSEMRGIPHHLIDVASPTSRFTAARYQRLARRSIADIIGRKKVPIICGGTGFYVQSAIEGTEFPDAAPNYKLRGKLSKKSAPELYELLKKLDPKRAESIDRNNPVRLIRAIEIAKAIGKVPLLSKKSGEFDVLYIGIAIPRKQLRQRIHKRLFRRIRAGMISEAKHLHTRGVSWKRMEELGLEYRYLARYLTGKISKAEMITELEKEIVRYAKRQMTWFNRNREIHWISGEQKARRLAARFLG